jgi:hypothetical protein
MDMASAAAKNTGVPEGFAAIPLSQSDEKSPLRLCVLLREKPDPAAGPLVTLRDLHDARVYLGCVTDAAGHLREWLELWVQNTDGLDSSLPAFRESFSNASLDARWLGQVAAFQELNPPLLLRTGWESAHPRPLFLDLPKAAPAGSPGKEPEHPWELCRDDQLLQAAALPAYSTSLFRYLHQPAAGAKTQFVPVTAGAPENSATRPLAGVMAEAGRPVNLNGQAGYMMVMSFSPLGLEDYLDLLGGKSWAGLTHGKRPLPLSGAYRGLMDSAQAQQDASHLFLGRRGRAGRLLETFHLKLQLLADVLRQTRAFVQKRQLPFLNLGADSFRVSLKEIGAGLPVLWTAQCSLVKPGNAFELPVETSEFKYFIQAGNPGASIYLPEGLGARWQGAGSVRIRKVLPPEHGRVSLEGTLLVQESLPASPHDLLWLRLPLPSGRVDLYGHVSAADGLAQGEVRFRTVPQKLPDSVIETLRGAEGVPFARSPFEVVPLLSSPCDLYSFGVIAVRALLVDEKNTLAVALDEIMSFARQLAAERNAETPLGTRVRTILERDERYAASLGPHHLNREGLPAEQALQLMPPALWHDTLGLIASLFPGLGPDSVCRDFGDAPPLALETVFNRPLEELEKLLLRSRSLIVTDWSSNQEIHAAIKDCLGGG